MAVQKGILPLQGTIQNITFTKSRDGFGARAKGGVSAQRIATDPAFARTRENGAEFARAGKAGKMLRSVLRRILLNTSDRRMVSRLTQALHNVLKADITNGRGMRNIGDGNIEVLAGFEFNANSALSTTFSAQYEKTIDRPLGKLALQIAPFVPAHMVAAPAGATHFKLISAGAEIDFEGQEFTSDVQSSAMLPWNEDATAAITLDNNVKPGSVHPLLLALGIEFYQNINGTYYPLRNGTFNCLSLVGVKKT
jgi:hypothetical protein